MTPRDWFAGMAMRPLMSKYPHPEYDYSTVAAMAYRVADAMMEEREKHALVPQQTAVIPASIRSGLGT